MADGAPLPDETSFAPDPLDHRPMRAALGRFATGVTIVTCVGPDGPVGITANSFASVSLDPPLVLWSPARASSRYGVFEAARAFAIHVLADDQQGLAGRFTRGGAGFDGLQVGVGEMGVPTLPGTLARFECRHHGAHDGGDHLIMLGYVLRIALNDGKPLVFSQGAWGGFAPFA